MQGSLIQARIYESAPTLLAYYVLGSLSSPCFSSPADLEAGLASQNAWKVVWAHQPVEE